MFHFRSLLLTATVGLAASLASCSSARYFDFTTTAAHRSAYHTSVVKATPAVVVSPVAVEAPAALTTADLSLTASAAPVVAPITAAPRTSTVRPPAPAALRLSEQLQAGRAERQLTRAQERRYERVVRRVKSEEIRREAAGQAVDPVELILAIFLPPIGVLLHEDGKLTTRFWISLLLTLLFFIPGMIYAILVVTNTI